MKAKIASPFVILIGAWLLSGRFLAAALFAVVVTALAFVNFGWTAIQWFGVALLFAAFLKVSGLVPFWPA